MRHQIGACVVAGGLLIGVGLLSAGCRTEQRQVPLDVERAGSERVTVQPAWREYALNNYRGELGTVLGNDRDPLFALPTVTASRNLKSGDIELMAIGEVDTTNLQGDRIRRPYYVIWRQEGNDWVPVERQIDVGGPVPEEAERPLPRAAPPATTPTPADPNAAPPARNEPPVVLPPR